MYNIGLVIEYIDDIKEMLHHATLDDVHKQLKKAQHPVAMAIDKFDFKYIVPTVIATLDHFLPVLEASLTGYEALSNAHATIENKDITTHATIDIKQHATYNNATANNIEQSEMFETTNPDIAELNARLKALEAIILIDPTKVDMKRKKKELAPPPANLPKNYRHWTVSRNPTGQYRLVKRISPKKVICKSIGSVWNTSKADAAIDEANKEYNLQEKK